MKASTGKEPQAAASKSKTGAAADLNASYHATAPAASAAAVTHDYGFHRPSLLDDIRHHAQDDKAVNNTTTVCSSSNDHANGPESTSVNSKATSATQSSSKPSARSISQEQQQQQQQPLGQERLSTIQASRGDRTNRRVKPAGSNSGAQPQRMMRPASASSNPRRVSQQANVQVQAQRQAQQVQSQRRQVQPPQPPGKHNKSPIRQQQQQQQQQPPAPTRASQRPSTSAVPAPPTNARMTTSRPRHASRYQRAIHQFAENPPPPELVYQNLHQDQPYYYPDEMPLQPPNNNYGARQPTSRRQQRQPQRQLQPMSPGYRNPHQRQYLNNPAPHPQYQYDYYDYDYDYGEEEEAIDYYDDGANNLPYDPRQPPMEERLYVDDAGRPYRVIAPVDTRRRRQHYYYPQPPRVRSHIPPPRTMRQPHHQRYNPRHQQQQQRYHPGYAQQPQYYSPYGNNVRRHHPKNPYATARRNPLYMQQRHLQMPPQEEEDGDFSAAPHQIMPPTRPGRPPAMVTTFEEDTQDDYDPQQQQQQHPEQELLLEGEDSFLYSEEEDPQPPLPIMQPTAPLNRRGMLQRRHSIGSLSSSVQDHDFIEHVVPYGSRHYQVMAPTPIHSNQQQQQRGARTRRSTTIQGRLQSSTRLATAAAPRSQQQEPMLPPTSDVSIDDDEDANFVEDYDGEGPGTDQFLLQEEQQPLYGDEALYNEDDAYNGGYYGPPMSLQRRHSFGSMADGSYV